MALHYLPAYSPNLNPIERLTKFKSEESANMFFNSEALFIVEIAICLLKGLRPITCS